MKTSKKGILLLIIVILLTQITGCQNNKSEPVESKTDFLMNTISKIDLYGNKNKDTMKKVYSRLYEIENRMSKTISISDISKVNELAGKEPVKVNPDTYEVLKEAIELAELTNGAFDPTIGKLVSLWDIKENEKERDTIPSEEEIESLRSKVDYKKIELLPGYQVRLKSDDVELDLGGIVKGYGADEARDIILKDGIESAIVDLGGDLNLIGEKPDGSPWRIGIQNPTSETGSHMGILSVKNSSVVTSGNYERYFEKDGKRYHHIIDPSTGYPAESNLASVTIISEDSIIGDAYATAFYILGVEESLKIIDKLDKNVEAIFITKDNEVYLTDGIKDSFTIENEEFKLIDWK